MGTWSTNTPTTDPADYRAGATHTATGATITIRIQESIVSDTSYATVGEPVAADVVAALIASGDFSDIGAFRQYGGSDSYTP